MKRTRGLLLSIHIDRDSPLRVGDQLYTALRDLILTASLKAGTRLPSSRTLAEDMGVSRTTVINAFDRLIQEGLVESRRGSGSFISKSLGVSYSGLSRSDGSVNSGAGSCKPRVSRAAASGLLSNRTPHLVKPFTTALPAYDAFPLGLWTRQVAKHWRRRRDSIMNYADPAGYEPLRRAIAAHVRTNRGITCEPEEIFIVNGAQQAFHLIGTLLLDHGETVWFENPGAIGARNSLISQGAKLVPVPVDNDGLIVEEGLERAPDFRLIFVTPSHQQPIGCNLSLRRRLQLLAAAEHADAWIIEDDYDSEFIYTGHPLPALKSLDMTGRVIYVGTFSKTLFPSLRLGYVVAPPPLVEVFQHAADTFLTGAPSDLQMVVADFMDEGHFTAHIRRMRRIYAERHHVFYEESQRKLAGLLDIEATETGFHTIGHLPPRLSESRVSSAAKERGIVVTPIAQYCIEPVPLNGLVLGFSCIQPAEIKKGISVLADVLGRLVAD